MDVGLLTVRERETVTHSPNQTARGAYIYSQNLLRPTSDDDCCVAKPASGGVSTNQSSIIVPMSLLIYFSSYPATAVLGAKLCLSVGFCREQNLFCWTFCTDHKSIKVNTVSVLDMIKHSQLVPWSSAATASQHGDADDDPIRDYLLWTIADKMHRQHDGGELVVCWCTRIVLSCVLGQLTGWWFRGR